MQRLNKPLNTLGAAVPVTLAAIVAAGGLLALSYSTFTDNPSALAQSLVPTSSEINLLIRSAGVNPESLAAAGISAGTIATIISDASDYIVPNFTAIQANHDTLAQNRKTRDTLQRLVSASRATSQQRTQLATAITNVAAAQATRDAYLAAIRQEIDANLTAAQITALDTIINNGANGRWTHPIQYKAANRSEQDWVDLRDCLANIRIATKRGEQPDPAATTFVAQADANAAVSAANTGLNNLPFIQAQWENALNG